MLTYFAVKTVVAAALNVTGKDHTTCNPAIIHQRKVKIKISLYTP